jgi:RNA polymerase sigma-70 factor (ECF subfamily)
MTPAPAPEDDDDDPRLVRRVLEGERQAFEPLMRRHNRRLFRAARAILRDDDEAEDVLQQAYLLAYHNLASFRGEASVGTWLTRIAVHEALARRRRRSNHAELTLVEPMETRMPSPEDDASRQQLAKLLERHIDALPEGYRTVFVLRDVEELDTAETARCLGLSEEAVRVRLHRARHLLQGSLLETLGESARETFGFAGARCDRIVAHVMVVLSHFP